MKKLVLATGFCVAIATLAWGQSGRAGWDGTWAGGWDRNAGVQLIFAGDTLIAFHWRGDYKDVARTSNTPDGGKWFAWARGEATLKRTPDGGAQLVVEEGGNKLSIPLRRE